MKPIAVLASEYEPERQRVIQESGADLDDDFEAGIAKSIAAYGWALYRVEQEHWGESPWSYCWPEAYGRCVLDDMLGTKERDTFGKHHDTARVEWQTAHPEWEQAQRERRAAESGRLF